MTDSFRIPAGRSALLIDGDNLGAALVPQILQHSGGAEVRRVYANLCQRKDWADQPDLRAIHSGTGKNATDMLIAIEAMELALSGAVASVVLASSDGDFAHLAHRLRERGMFVTGMGEGKTPAGFRKACSRFVELAQPDPPAAPTPPVRKLSGHEKAVIQLLTTQGGKMQIGKIGAAAGLTLTEIGASNWRGWLTARPHLFACDPKGPQAQVRLKA